MTVRDFSGKTFVAYVDISGFKEMMNNKKRALRALDHFYNSGYRILDMTEYGNSVCGIFVSDCCVLFAVDGDEVDKLRMLLEVVRELNRAMLNKNIMLTTSLAFGEFIYRNRIEIGSSVRKSPVYGYAYLEAYLDHERGKPKIKPGQCRILKKNLPESVREVLRERNIEIFQFVKQRRGDRNHYYFYWNCQDPAEINIFERNYSDAEKLVYERYLKALKGEYWVR